MTGRTRDSSSHHGSGSHSGHTPSTPSPSPSPSPSSSSPSPGGVGGRGTRMDPDAVESLGGKIAGRGDQVRADVASKLNINATSGSAGVFGQVAMQHADRAIQTAR